MKRLVLALAVAVCATTAAADQPVTVFGGPDCGEWVAAAVRVQRNRGWLMGYLSGINYARQVLLRPAPRDALAELQSADQAFLWMDNWCKAHPLETVFDGGNELFYELVAKADKK